MGIIKFQPPTKSIPLNRSIKKLGVVDYVHETTPYTKFGTNTHTGEWGLLSKWMKYNKNYFFYLFIPFFSQTRVQVRPVDGFLRAIAQKTSNHARMCLLGVIKLKYNFKPLFIPKTVKFRPKTGLSFFSTENA